MCLLGHLCHFHAGVTKSTRMLASRTLQITWCLPIEVIEVIPSTIVSSAASNALSQDSATSKPKLKMITRRTFANSSVDSLSCSLISAGSSAPLFLAKA